MQTIVMQEFLDHVLNGLGLSYTGKQIQKIENNYEAAYIIFDVDLFNRLGLTNRVSSAIFECDTPCFIDYQVFAIEDCLGYIELFLYQGNFNTITEDVIEINWNEGGAANPQ